MKHNGIISIVLIGSFMLLTASCEKEITSNEDLYRPAGSPIAFSATTSYTNSPETRAEYSGEFLGGTLNSSTPVYERIYWEPNDKIRIVHNGTGANYTVSSGTNNTGERESVATLSSGNLVWDGSGNHIFYGLYPSTGESVTTTNTGGLTDAGVVSGKIPATQNISTNSDRILTVTEGGVTYSKYQPNTDEYGYMAAYATIAANSNVYEVRLPFRPAFTTFEFKLQRAAGEPDPAITSFELKTVEVDGTTTPLTGNFSFQITGGDTNGALWTTPAASSITSPGYSVTVGGFGSNGVHVPTTGYLDFSVLALPINLKGVELVIHYANSATKTLKFKNSGSWHEFTGAKKYVITNTSVPGGNWVYDIQEIPDITTYGHAAANLGVEVVSYRVLEIGGVKDWSTLQAVQWKAQYWDGTNWQDWTSAYGDFSLGSSYTGNGVNNLSNHEDRTVSLVVNTHKETVTQTSIDILQNNPQVTDYDLSMHDVFGNLRDDPTTANSYVISAPGTYLFPCVYGNAITNGDWNYEAFAPGGNDSSIKNIYNTYVKTYFDTAIGGALPIYQYPDVNYVPYFKNALNDDIRQPWIIEDINSHSAYNVVNPKAAIVWQDEQILSDSDFDVITVGGHHYIKFTLSRTNIKPGNIVVALRGAAGGSFTDSKTILWSWQLWITERDLTPIDGIMPSNLGWNKVYNGSQKYTDRILPIRLIQIAPADDPTGAIDNEPFTVTQFGDSEDLGENVGSNPYYQWGRKDPMIPGMYDPIGPGNVVGEPCSDRTIYAGSDYSGITSNATLISADTYYFDGSNHIHGSGPVVSYPGADYGTAIRNPHVVYIASDGTAYETTSWIAGYIPAWSTITGDGHNTGGVFQHPREDTALPYNLWNAACFGYGNPGTNWSETTKYKTVYDPCPPGFTVPHRGLQSLLGNGSDAPDHSGKNFTMSSGAVHFFPYSGARIFYNTTNPIPGTSVVVSHPGIYLRHVAGATNVWGLYWTDCPQQFRQNAAYGQPNDFLMFGNYSMHQWSTIFQFTPTGNDTGMYTKGTAAAIRPMVDPRY